MWCSVLTSRHCLVSTPWVYRTTTGGKKERGQGERKRQRERKRKREIVSLCNHFLHVSASTKTPNQLSKTLFSPSNRMYTPPGWHYALSLFTVCSCIWLDAGEERLTNPVRHRKCTWYGSTQTQYPNSRTFHIFIGFSGPWMAPTAGMRDATSHKYPGSIISSAGGRDGRHPLQSFKHIQKPKLRPFRLLWGPRPRPPHSLSAVIIEKLPWRDPQGTPGRQCCGSAEKAICIQKLPFKCGMH